MTIIDNRTLITANDTTANIVDLVGAADGNQNTETFIEGTASVSVKISNTIGGLLFDFGAATDLSNNHFYFWWNVSTAGKLDTKVLGGVRIRFCGATVTDFFEVNIEGSDTYSGGFKMTVVDIEDAAANPDATGGTPPATTAIRFAGLVFDVIAMISGNVDNCFIDAFWRLPQNIFGILVEGQDTGPVDWTWQDIVDAADVGDPAKAWGSAFRRDGIVFINTPIRFGANDAATHGFSDTNEVVAWEDQRVAVGFYKLEIIGGSGIQSFQLGNREGTGDPSTGNQGGVITAPSAGARWDLDCDDVNIDLCDLFGVTIQHADDIQVDDVNTELRSCQIIDCNALVQSLNTFQRNVIAGANTLDGVPFITTSDPSDIKNCSFTFSDGHAIKATAVGTFTFTGNKFSGYGAGGTNDAAFFNDSGGLITLNIEGEGDTPTVRNGAGASTTINNTVTVKISGMTEGTSVKVIADDTVGSVTKGDVLLEVLADANGEASFSHNFEGNLVCIFRMRQQGLPNACIADDGGVFTDETAEANSSTVNDMTLTPVAPAVNDAYYFGHNEQFGKLKLDISQIFTGTTLDLAWEYFNGTIYTALSSVIDGTNAFKNLNESEVAWTVPGDWADDTVNGQGPFHYVRARVTAIAGITQQPLGRKVKLDVTRFRPDNQTRTILSGGLTVFASWVEDTIALF